MPLERLAQLVDDRAQIVLRNRPHQGVDAREDVGDGGGHLGVGLFDAGAVREVGGPVALRPQVDVLLADGGEPGDHGLGVGGDAGADFLIRSSATTPSSVRPIGPTRPTETPPRYVTSAWVNSPPVRGSSTSTV